MSVTEIVMAGEIDLDGRRTPSAGNVESALNILRRAHVDEADNLRVVDTALWIAVQDLGRRVYNLEARLRQLRENQQ